MFNLIFAYQNLLNLIIFTYFYTYFYSLFLLKAMIFLDLKRIIFCYDIFSSEIIVKHDWIKKKSTYLHTYFTTI